MPLFWSPSQIPFTPVARGNAEVMCRGQAVATPSPARRLAHALGRPVHPSARSDQPWSRHAAAAPRWAAARHGFVVTRLRGTPGAHSSRTFWNRTGIKTHRHSNAADMYPLHPRLNFSSRICTARSSRAPAGKLSSSASALNLATVSAVALILIC